MDILILTFSPSGSTLKISKILADKLTHNGHAVQLINFTGQREFFRKNQIRQALANQVRPHDLLLLGAPVYEKHLEYYVKDVIKALPTPDETWGRHAVPFVTFGGISSGKALIEATTLLQRSGRTVSSCMKIESSHIVNKRLKARVNEGMPGEEALSHIDRLVAKLELIEPQHKISGDLRPQLDCHNFREKIFCALLNERLLHKYKYPQFKIIEDRCKQCNTCVAVCPVQRIEPTDSTPQMCEQPECIHCFACGNACPNDAITFVNGDEGWNLIDRIYSKVAAEDSIFRSKENPKSEVYSLL